jgi:hypothetical protein
MMGSPSAPRVSAGGTRAGAAIPFVGDCRAGIRDTQEPDDLFCRPIAQSMADGGGQFEWYSDGAYTCEPGSTLSSSARRAGLNSGDYALLRGAEGTASTMLIRTHLWIEGARVSTSIGAGFSAMLARLRAWRAKRRRKDRAVRRAVREFHARRGFAPMSGHVLRLDSKHIIVRVMYVTDHIPPDRAWFAVSEEDDEVQELTFNDVAHLETAWR